VRELVERTLVPDPAARVPDGAALVAAVAGAAAGRTPEPADERHATRVLPAVPAQQPVTATLPVSPVAAAAVPPVVPAPDGDVDEEVDEEVDEDADDRSRLRRLLVPVLVGVVATALVVTGLVLGSRDVPAPAAPPAAAATSTAPPTSAAPRPTGTFVRVDPARYVGQPVARVQAWLTGLDLPVELRSVVTTDVPAGRVMDLQPTGELPVGTTVTVTHAVAPPPPPPPPPTVAPTPTPTPETVTDTGIDRKGKDKDRGRDRRDEDDD
jgi:serine/threonine-protein kinase